jgi:hypothetical protein
MDVTIPEKLTVIGDAQNINTLFNSRLTQKSIINKRNEKEK